MEWVDMASWGLGELERSAENAPGGDCSVDLKLGGGFGYSEEKEGEQQHKHKVPTVGSSKRPRGPVGGAAVSCMVDGCTSDLTNSKDYHRRHKVCELHSKSPMAFVGGQQQRFCQQCSR